MMITVAALLVQASPAHAQAPWVLASKTNSSVIYINARTIKAITPDIREAWFKYVYHEIQPNGTSYLLTKRRFNCADESAASISIIAYDKDGSPLNSVEHSGSDAVYESTPPGTSQETQQTLVCSTKL